MTLVLSTSKAQLLLMVLFAHKLRSCWCLHTNLTLQNILFSSPPPSPGIQRWGCKCAQQFSVKRVKEEESKALHKSRQVTPQYSLLYMALSQSSVILVSAASQEFRCEYLIVLGINDKYSPKEFRKMNCVHVFQDPRTNEAEWK